MKRLAKDIMNPNVVTVTESMDLREAAKIFVEERISGAPVIDEVAQLVDHRRPTDSLLDKNLRRLP